MRNILISSEAVLKKLFKTFQFGIVILLVINVSCQQARPTTSKQAAHTKGKPVQEKLIEKGVASWYGPGFQGKKTASGQIFDTNKLTAAHRTLPFDTQLIVKNTLNGRMVTVTVNDRGPFAKSRIIDLSKAAAKQLDMLNAGTAKVEIYLVSKTSEDLELSDIKSATYTVQIASYQNFKLATEKANKIKDGWVKKVTVKGNTIYRVFVGNYKNKSSANQLLANLKKQKINGFVKQVEN